MNLTAGWLWAAELGGLVVGLALLRYGVWPRRRGDVPYCRKCGYNLTALPSDRCPECGTPLAPEKIVRGERRRRPTLITVGALSVSIALGLLASSLRNVNWYQHRPTRWVMADLRSTNVDSAMRALSELERRIGADRLSVADQTKLIEFCLAEQVAEPPSAIVNMLVSHLERRHVRGGRGLSKAQEARFLRQLVTLSLRVRPRVVLGDQVPYSVIYRGRACYPIVSHFTSRKALVDERPVSTPRWGPVGLGWDPVSAADYVISRYGTPRALNGALSLETPGPHRMTLVMHVTIGRHRNIGPSLTVTSDSFWDCFYETDVPLSATFEILPAEPPGYIKLISDESVHDILIDAVTPQNFTYGKAHPRFLAGFLRIEPLPVNIAFDVFARIGRQEHRIGRVTMARGERGTRYCHEEMPSPPSDFVDIILRSSQKVARQTVDLYEIWDGELLYDNVPVEISQSQTTP